MPSNIPANSQQLDTDMMVHIWIFLNGLLNGKKNPFQTYHIHWLIPPPTGRTVEQFSDDLSGRRIKKQSKMSSRVGATIHSDNML